MTDTSQKRDGKQNVVVTGFGLFRDHLLNPSWEAIKDGQLNIDRLNINIITKEISVSYQEVDQVVEQLWKTYQPLLMVHVGLAAFESAIRIEQVARHGPYIHDDIVQYAPHKDLRLYTNDSRKSTEENVKKHDYSCKPCRFESSQTCFDIDRVCEKLNLLHGLGKISLPFKKSTNAGLYVCEYIYQKSLKISNRTVFIHVPDIDRFKLEDIRVALKFAIETLIDETNEII